MSDVEVQRGAEARAHLEKSTSTWVCWGWATDFALRMLDVCDGLLLGRMSLSRRYATDADVQCISKFLDLSVLVVNVRADGERATCILLPEGGALEPPVGQMFPDGVADVAVVRACDHFDWVQGTVMPGEKRERLPKVARSTSARVFNHDVIGTGRHALPLPVRRFRVAQYIGDIFRSAGGVAGRESRAPSLAGGFWSPRRTDAVDEEGCADVSTRGHSGTCPHGLPGAAASTAEGVVVGGSRKHARDVSAGR